MREAGVIGQPDPVFSSHACAGERVVACVALRSGQASSESEVREFAGTFLADYQAPETVVFLPEPPKGPTGKVDRRALKEMLAGGQACAATVA